MGTRRHKKESKLLEFRRAESVDPRDSGKSADAKASEAPIAEPFAKYEALLDEACQGISLAKQSKAAARVFPLPQTIAAAWQEYCYIENKQSGQKKSRTARSSGRGMAARRRLIENLLTTRIVAVNIDDIWHRIMYLKRCHKNISSEENAAIIDAIINDINQLVAVDKSSRENETTTTGQDAELAALRDKLLRLNQDIKKLTDELINRDIRLKRLNGAVLSRNDTITHSNARLASHDNRIKRLNAAIVERDKVLGRIRAQLATGDERIKRLNGALIDSNKELKRLKAERENQSVNDGETKTKIKQIHSEIVAHGQDIVTLQASISEVQTALGKQSEGLEHLQSSIVRQEAERRPRPRSGNAYPGKHPAMWLAGAAIVIVLAFGGWAATTTVEQTAVARGKVMLAEPLIEVQHIDGGIIAEIMVKDGDRVEPGQALLRFDPATIILQLQQIKVRHANLEAQAERLRAVSLGLKPGFVNMPAEYVYLAKEQMTVYEANENDRHSLNDMVRLQIDQGKADIALFDEQKNILKKHLALLQKELKTREAAFSDGDLPQSAVLDAKYEVEQLRGDITELHNQRNRRVKDISHYQDRLVALDAKTRKSANDQLAPITEELSQVVESIARLEDSRKRLQVKAALPGIVKGINDYDVGDVIAADKPFFAIVPLAKALMVKVHIADSDIKNINIGQAASVAVLAYNHNRYPPIAGELTAVSMDTVIDVGGKPYHTAVVTLAQGYAGKDAKHYNLLPGMDVKATIKANKTTLLRHIIAKLPKW